MTLNDFMNSSYGWPMTEAVHYIALSMLLGTVGIFDLRVLGVGRGIAIASLHRFVPVGVCGFVLSLTTGAMFFVSATDQYLYNPAFQLKVMCMLIAGINMMVFYATTARALKLQSPDVPVPLAAKLMAGISLLCWTGVIIFGRLITMFRPPYHWCFWC